MKHYEKDVAAPPAASKAGFAEDSDDSEAGRKLLAGQHAQTSSRISIDPLSQNMMNYENASLQMPMNRQPDLSHIFTVAAISTPACPRLWLLA